MKKILFMISSMNIGGVEKSLLSLLTIIPQDQYEVTVLMLHKRGGFLELLPSWIQVKEVEWYRQIEPILMQSPYQTVKQYISNKEWLKMIDFIVSYYIAKYLKDRSIYFKSLLKGVPIGKESYDVAIAYPGPTEIIDYYIVNKVKAKHRVQWIHFDLSQLRPNKKLYEKLFKRFNRIFVVSQEGREKLVETYRVEKEKVQVFNNIVSEKIIQAMAEERIDLDEQFLGTKIVTVGRLSKEKGQDLAIHVLVRLKQEGYLVRWYCIGEGKARGEYEQLIKQYQLEKEFILIGETSNPYPYMKNADLYVQTSRHEGFCLTLAEAKCLNKPIITTSFTGAKEQIQHGQTGLIVEETVEGLYTAITYLLDHPEEKSRLCNNLKVS